jgi:hypothetical protein
MGPALKMAHDITREECIARTKKMDPHAGRELEMRYALREAAFSPGAAKLLGSIRIGQDRKTSRDDYEDATNTLRCRHCRETVERRRLAAHNEVCKKNPRSQK